MSQEYELLQARKRRYIPLCCAGKLTEKECAKRIGITTRAVSYIKKRYRLRGNLAFTNAHKGEDYQPHKFSPILRAEVCRIYREDWPGSNFAAFRDRLEEFYHIRICTRTLTKILNADGIVSPKWRGPKKEKKKHLPREERKHTGELLQLDASEYDWLLNGEKLTLHGAVDDATHEFVGLYLCRNECRLGYSEVMRQCLVAKGKPVAVYIDRHAAFVKNEKKNEKTLEERLAYSKGEETHWTTICDRLHTEIILALSPQAKGRVERAWQTLQGRLPFLMRYRKIKTIEDANIYLEEYMHLYNRRFSVTAAEKDTCFLAHGLTDDELEFLLAVKVEKRTRYNGEFTFHGFTFRLDAPRAACRTFTLCLSEKDGIRAWMDGKYYPVSIVDELTDCVGDPMPQVEKDLIARYLLADTRKYVYQFSDKKKPTRRSAVV